MLDALKEYIDADVYTSALGYDDEIDHLLFMYGAIRDVEDYYDYRFAGDYEQVEVLDASLVREIVYKA